MRDTGISDISRRRWNIRILSDNINFIIIFFFWIILVILIGAFFWLLSWLGLLISFSCVLRILFRASCFVIFCDYYNSVSILLSLWLLLRFFLLILLGCISFNCLVSLWMLSILICILLSWIFQFVCIWLWSFLLFFLTILRAMILFNC